MQTFVGNTIPSTLPSPLTAADIPTDITAANYVPLAGGTLTGALLGTDLTLSGNLTVSGAQTLSGAITVPYVVATSTTAVSSFQQILANASTTLQNFTALNSTSTNATSTSLFAATASSTNLFSSLATLASATIGSLTASGLGTFTGGLISQASSTIGNGTQAGGLTISGGATTTRNLSVNGTFNAGANGFSVGAIGVLTAGAGLSISGSVGAAPANGTILITPGAANRNALTIKLSASPTADIFRALDSGGNFLDVINSNGNFGIGTSSAYSLLSISNSATTPANTPLFTIASTTGGAATSTLLTVLANGNVGIGTANPASELTIALPSNTDFNLRLDGSTGIQQYRGNASAGGLNLVTQLTSGSWGSGGGYISLSPGNSEALRATVGGNVGIGTTSPNTNLNIYGSSPILAIDNANSGGLDFLQLNEKSATKAFIKYRGTTNTPANQLQIGTNSTGGTLALQTGSGSTALYINSSGNVGIATTSPTSFLTIQSNIQNAITLDANTSANDNAIRFTDNSVNEAWVAITKTNSLITGASQDDLAFRSQAHNIIFTTANGGGSIQEIITSSGNVGIGTTSPDMLLSVGSATPVGNVAHFENSTGSCYINPTTTSLSCSSDARLKNNINSLTATSGIAALMQLNPVTYNWNSEATGTPTHVGFIAQQVLPILPDLVSQGPDGYYTLNYAGLTPYLVKGIQEIATISAGFKDALIAWLGDASNGITQFFADTITANKQLCIKKSDGTRVCVTGDQLDALLTNANVPSTATQNGDNQSPSASQSDPSAAAPLPESVTATTTSPSVSQISDPTPPSSSATSTPPSVSATSDNPAFGTDGTTDTPAAPSIVPTLDASTTPVDEASSTSQ